VRLHHHRGLARLGRVLRAADGRPWRPAAGHSRGQPSGSCDASRSLTTTETKRRRPTALSGRLAFFFYFFGSSLIPEGGRKRSSQCALVYTRTSYAALLSGSFEAGRCIGRRASSTAATAPRFANSSTEFTLRRAMPTAG